MSTIIPAPAHSLARAAWIPTRVIWYADSRFTHLKGAPCADYAAAQVVSSRLRPSMRDGEPQLRRLPA